MASECALFSKIHPPVELLPLAWGICSRPPQGSCSSQRRDSVQSVWSKRAVGGFKPARSNRVCLSHFLVRFSLFASFNEMRARASTFCCPPHPPFCSVGNAFGSGQKEGRKECQRKSQGLLPRRSSWNLGLRGRKVVGQLTFLGLRLIGSNFQSVFQNAAC